MGIGKELLHKREDRSSLQDDWYLQRRREIVRRQNAPVQAKLEISHPDDPHEKQAEATGKAVAGGSEIKVQRLAENPGSVYKKAEGNVTTVPENFQHSLESSKGGGNKMEEHTKSAMEEKMGADFSGVNIHTGANAHDMSENINAKAFTHGQDVYFKNGNYNPDSHQGKELLAHELTHTVQQKDGVNREVMRQPDAPKKKEVRDKTYVAPPLIQRPVYPAILKNVRLDKTKSASEALKKRKENLADQKKAAKKTGKGKTKKKIKGKAIKAGKQIKKSISKTGTKQNVFVPVKKKPQQFKPQSPVGKKHKPTPYIESELNKFKTEAGAVKNRISASGNAGIQIIRSAAKAEKLAIDIKAKATLNSVNLLFDGTISKIRLAVRKAYTDTVRGRILAIAKVKADANAKLKELDKKTKDKQVEVVALGNKYVQAAEKNRADLLKMARDKTFAQIAKVNAESKKIIDGYATDPRSVRINTNISDMANETNKSLLENEITLEKTINDNSDDLVKKYKDEYTDAYGDLPDGKDAAADQIRKLRDDTVDQITVSDTSSLDQLKKNSEDLINQLLDNKLKATNHVRKLVGDGKRAIDAQARDAENKLNGNIADLNASIDKVEADADAKTPGLTNKLAKKYFNKGYALFKKTEADFNKNLPLFITQAKDIFSKGSATTNGYLDSTYNDMISPAQKSGEGMVKSASDTSAKLIKVFNDSEAKGLKGMNDVIDEYVKKLDESIKKSGDQWATELTDSYKEIKDKVDETIKKGDDAVASSISDMKDEALQLSTEYEATYLLRSFGAMFWGFLKKLGNILLWLLKWIGIILLVIVAIIIIIALLPEALGTLVATILELLITFIIDAIGIMIADLMAFLATAFMSALMTVFMDLFVAYVLVKIVDILTSDKLSMRQKQEQGGDKLFDLSLIVVTEWSKITEFLGLTEEATAFDRVLAKAGGDEELARMLLEAGKEAEVLALLEKVSAVELETLLLKLGKASEVERFLPMVGGDAKLLTSLLSKVDDAAQLERMLSKVKDAKDLERLLGEAGNATELENVLNKLPEGTSVEGKTYDTLKTEAEGAGENSVNNDTNPKGNKNKPEEDLEAAKKKAQELAGKQWNDFEYADLGTNKPLCFPPGTIVKTPLGDTAIENLKVGDEVYAYDIGKEELVIRKITCQFSNWTDRLIKIKIDGETIESTFNHNFWVESESKWLPALLLKEGMKLKLLNGKDVQIEAVESYFNVIETYNFEVNITSNYFVGNRGVLTHNKTSAFADLTKRNSYIYEIINPANDGIVYVGKTDRTIAERFAEHLKDSKKLAWKTGRYYWRMAESGSWTTYETAVWEQHYIMKDGGLNKLENAQSGITEAKFNLYKKLHNPCLMP
ncbi:MAG: DUF4157 domain-containing protein [Bacteroidetes bacterium]|nr:DUF4157 domain-containing protein [Bacteroidota bacterium]